MKNLKKLNRNDLKTINGGDWIDDINNILNQLQPLITPIIKETNTGLCNIQCVVNGITSIKVLPCGSTC